MVWLSKSPLTLKTGRQTNNRRSSYARGSPHSNILTAELPLPFQIPRSVNNACSDQADIDTEFLESVNIVPFPPPLHQFSWAELNGIERKIAFNELQTIIRAESISGGNGSQEQQAGNSWVDMSHWQRREAFEELQVRAKSRIRALAHSNMNLTPESPQIIRER